MLHRVHKDLFCRRVQGWLGSSSTACPTKWEAPSCCTRRGRFSGASTCSWRRAASVPVLGCDQAPRPLQCSLVSNSASLKRVPAQEAVQCRECESVAGSDLPRMAQCATVLRQADRRVACGVALEDLAPVMHVAETWEERDMNCAVVANPSTSILSLTASSRCSSGRPAAGVCEVTTSPGCRAREIQMASAAAEARWKNSNSRPSGNCMRSMRFKYPILYTRWDIKQRSCHHEAFPRRQGGAARSV